MEEEIWKPIKDYEGLYEVSSIGRVRSLGREIIDSKGRKQCFKERILKLQYDRYGYLYVPLRNRDNRKKFKVHRLVAEAFIPNPDNLPQINHIDGNKDNNKVENLEWCTNKYNVLHAHETGLNWTEKHRKRSSLECNFRKLTIEQVSYIREAFKNIDCSIRGNKMKFCREMIQKFNLKSPHTILWILKEQGGTNRYTNQDIVQTTNSNNTSNENCSGKEIA